MEGTLVWPSVFFGEKCNPRYIYHTIVPTAFTTRIASWKKVLERANTDHPRWKEVQRRNGCCCFCGMELFEQKAILAVRVVLQKRPCVKIPNSPLVVMLDDPSPTRATQICYRWAFGSASICAKCTEARNLRLSFNSNSKMHEEMFRRLEYIGAEVALDAFNKDVAPEIILQRVLEAFDSEEHRTEFMRSIGKIDNSVCMFCKGPSRRRCSGCHFARYCGEKCSVADWKIHKIECKPLAACPIFYGGKKNVVMEK